MSSRSKRKRLARSVSLPPGAPRPRVVVNGVDVGEIQTLDMRQLVTSAEAGGNGVAYIVRRGLRPVRCPECQAVIPPGERHHSCGNVGRRIEVVEDVPAKFTADRGVDEVAT